MFGMNSTSMRSNYEQFGVRGFYEQAGESYSNPHGPIIRHVIKMAFEQWKLEPTNILDLAAGGGEVTLACFDLGITKIKATDPFTYTLYQKRTGLSCWRWGFQEIARGLAKGFYNYNFDLIICSFALHLIDASWLPSLLSQLGRVGSRLLVISPNKQPSIKDEWGWLIDQEMTVERVHSRLFRKPNVKPVEDLVTRMTKHIKDFDITPEMEAFWKDNGVLLT